MILNKTVLAIIPARGGSKGIPGKNIREIAGKPLIAWTIEAAKKSKYIDRLILSSDDNDIIEVAKEWGCEVPFVRPSELARDDTPGIATVLHAIEALPEHYEYVVLLQPTSPLRSVNDIDDCIRTCIDHYAASCVSVTEPERSPYLMYSLDSTDHLLPLIEQFKHFSRRQDLPKVYALNGAIYVAKSVWLKSNLTFVSDETIAYEMPKHRSIDIDTEIDLKFAEFLLVEHFVPCL